MATKEVDLLVPLTVEIVKTVILVILVLAVYTTHLDIHSQLIRFHRRKQALKSPTTKVIKRTGVFKPNLHRIAELPDTTVTFRPTENRPLLPNRINTSSFINIPDCENLPPPAQDL